MRGRGRCRSVTERHAGQWSSACGVTGFDATLARSESIPGCVRLTVTARDAVTRLNGFGGLSAPLALGAHRQLHHLTWPEGNPGNQFRGTQTTLLGSSNSATVEFVIPEDGSYIMADHHFANARRARSGSSRGRRGLTVPGSPTQRARHRPHAPVAAASTGRWDIGLGTRARATPSPQSLSSGIQVPPVNTRIRTC
jgi:hypothetical protein